MIFEQKKNHYRNQQHFTYKEIPLENITKKNHNKPISDGGKKTKQILEFDKKVSF